MEVVLPPRGSLGEDEVFVPSGWFRAGGDSEAPDGLPGNAHDVALSYACAIGGGRSS